MKPLNDITYENWTAWKFNVESELLISGIDTALYEDKPEELTETSTQEDKAKYEGWKRSNRLSLMFMKMNMSDTLCLLHKSLRAAYESGIAKEFLGAIESIVMEDERIKAPNLLKKLTTMRYDIGDGGDVMKHLLEMGNLERRLRRVDVGIPEYVMNRLALDSLPSEFSPLRFCYSEKEQWGWNELVSRCRDFERFSMSMGENGDDDDDDDGGRVKRRKKVNCFSCGQKGHFARNCTQA